MLLKFLFIYLFILFYFFFFFFFGGGGGGGGGDSVALEGIPGMLKNAIQDDCSTRYKLINSIF